MRHALDALGLVGKAEIVALGEALPLPRRGLLKVEVTP